MRIQSLKDLHLTLPDIDGFWNHSDLARTESQIRAKLPTDEQVPTAQHIEAYTQLARLYSLQGQVKAAHAMMESARDLLTKISDSEKTRPEVRFYLEEGRLHCLAKYPAKALESFVKAWNLAEKAKLPLFAIDAAFMFSITLPAKQGKKWLQEAIKIAETSENAGGQVWMPHLYMMEGWQAFDTHDYEKALLFFENAISRLTLAASSDIERRTLLWSKARVLRSLNRISESLQIQEALLSEMDRMGEKNGYVYLELGECYQSLQDSAKAKNFYELALEVLKKDEWYADNYDGELSRIQKNVKNA